MSDFFKICSDVLLDVGKLADKARGCSNSTVYGGTCLKTSIDMAMVAAYRERTEVIREGLKTLAVLISRK